MPTNLAIDDQLLVRAQKLGRKKTKKDTVNEALAEYVQRREQKKSSATSAPWTSTGTMTPNVTAADGHCGLGCLVALICACAASWNAAILSTDKDFVSYAKHLPIKLDPA